MVKYVKNVGKHNMDITPERREKTEIDPLEAAFEERGGGNLGPQTSFEIPSEMIENTPSTRARSSLRQRYEAEARVIERRIGGLEQAREMLGLSQRKMAQLLLVDPSAWTRWTQSDQGAPPHVWRALAWYLALQEKYPALDAAFWLQGVARATGPAVDERLSRNISENADEIRAAKLHTRALEIKIQELSREIARLQQFIPAGSSKLEESEVSENGKLTTKAEQAETRALANFFIAFAFAILGFVVATFFMK